MKMVRSVICCLSAGLLATVLSGSSQGAIISVNFVGGQPNGAANVTTFAGAVSASNWNNESASAAGPVSINDSSGFSVATLTYTAPNNYAATGTTPAGGGDAALMNGYLDNFQNAGSITVSGLDLNYTTVAGYQVLVYQNADSAGSYGYTVTDNVGNIDTRYGQQLAGGGGNYPLGGTNGFVGSTLTNSAGNGTASNYVILSGFHGSSFTITGNSGTTGDGRVRPNGFQIVGVPEPTCLSAFLLGGAAVLVRRHRGH